jgi:hypothetical protein
MANAAGQAGLAQHLVCPGTPVNARVITTLNACRALPRQLGLLPPRPVLEVLHQPREAALALAAFRTRVST